MIPKQSGVEAVLSTQMEKAEAKIAMSAHMVDLLSSRVYTDKPSALIRELCCNGLDSHKMAGNELKPLKVHLPTRFDCYFEVQDFGTGLCHEDIFNLYMTYGASTKQDSNDVVGFMGIGSKSPFAYTDAFTVTSIFEGEKRIYSVFKNKGIPNVVLLNQMPTDEHSGLTVKIAVKEKDINDFRIKAQRIFRYFDVTPETNISIDTSLIKAFENEEFFTSSCNSFGGQRLYAVMGQVCYEVSSNEKTSKLFSLIDKDVYLKFNIGELSPAASREHLSDDEDTVEAINKKLDSIIADYLKEAQEQADKSDNVREAYKVVNGLIKGSISLQDFTYKGKTFSQWGDEFEDITHKLAEKHKDNIYYAYNNYYYSRKCKVVRESKFCGSSYALFGDPKGFVFLLKDLKRGGIAQFKELLRTGQTGIVIEDEADAEEIRKALYLDSVTIYKASEIHIKAPKAPATEGVRIIKHDRRNRLINTRIKGLDLNSIKKPVYYVEAHRKSWTCWLGIKRNDFGLLERMIGNDIINHIFILNKKDLKKLNNPNVKLLTEKDIVGMITPEMKQNLIYKEFQNNRLPKLPYEVFKESSVLTPKYHKLYKECEKYNSDLYYKYSLLVDCLGGQHQQYKLFERLLVNAGKITNIGADIVQAYPFVSQFNRAYSGFKFDESSLKYVKALVKLQDAGELDD